MVRERILSTLIEKCLRKKKLHFHEFLLLSFLMRSGLYQLDAEAKVLKSRMEAEITALEHVMQSDSVFYFLIPSFVDVRGKLTVRTQKQGSGYLLTFSLWNPRSTLEARTPDTVLNDILSIYLLVLNLSARNT